MNVHSITRFFVQTLRGSSRNFSVPSAQSLRHSSEGVYWLTRAFYVFMIFVAFQTLGMVDQIGASGKKIQALWPIFWINGLDLRTSSSLIGISVVIGAVSSVAFHKLRLPRIVLFISFLMAVALRNSFGSISHAEYYPLWLSFFMIFSPVRKLKPNASVSDHYFYALPFFVSQLFIGFFYTLSGAFKIEGGLFPKPGYVSSFSPEALPILMMGRWLEAGSPPMLEQFITDNMWLTWPAYMSVMYFEFFFVVAVFRPQIHRIFGIVIAVFHIGVFMTMSINFPYQSALVGLLFACSPFSDERASFRQCLYQLPLIGRLIHFFHMRRFTKRSGSPKVV